MKAETILEHLESAATAMSIRVSYEPIQVALGLGGLCRVKNEYRVIVDKRATAGERVSTLAKALARFDLSKLTLPAPVRDAIDAYVQTSRPRMAPLSGAPGLVKPLLAAS